MNDPSTNHNEARSKHQPTTGEWFLRSDGFLSWTEGNTVSIWLHGIPGAGKTVLCSTIIEHVTALCRSNSPQGRCAYFYFDFNNREKQTAVGMLRSTICQMCVPVLPPEVDSLYTSCGEGTRDPGLQDLLEAFISILRSPRRTYVILDALDECSEWRKLLSVLTQILATSPDSVRLLVTSRKVSEIAEDLLKTPSLVMDLRNTGGLTEDINTHVNATLEHDMRLRKWAPGIKEQMHYAIVQGSDGMYN